MSARRAETDPAHRPLLDAAELAGLIARGHRLARAATDRPAERGRQGGTASRHLGGGLDFAEHRRYQPGDDPRRMDWRLTARTGQAHVRRYHEDLVADCLILVDRRATMRFATRGRLKAAQAVRLAVLLAACHAGRQAPVSIIELDAGLHRHGPLADPQLPAVGRRLARPCPPLAEPGPALGAALVQADRQAAAGGRLLLLSDFADADAVPPTLWHRLASRHTVHAIRISDPVEKHLPVTTGAELCWPAGGTGHCLDLQPALKAQIDADAAARHAALADTLHQAGVRLHDLDTTTDDPLAGLRGLC